MPFSSAVLEAFAWNSKVRITGTLDFRPLSAEARLYRLFGHPAPPDSGESQLLCNRLDIVALKGYRIVRVSDEFVVHRYERPLFSSTHFSAAEAFIVQDVLRQPFNNILSSCLPRMVVKYARYYVGLEKVGQSPLFLPSSFLDLLQSKVHFETSDVDEQLLYLWRTLGRLPRIDQQVAVSTLKTERVWRHEVQDDTKRFMSLRPWTSTPLYKFYNGLWSGTVIHAGSGPVGALSQSAFPRAKLYCVDPLFDGPEEAGFRGTWGEFVRVKSHMIKGSLCVSDMCVYDQYGLDPSPTNSLNHQFVCDSENYGCAHWVSKFCIGSDLVPPYRVNFVSKARLHNLEFICEKGECFSFLELCESLASTVYKANLLRSYIFESSTPPTQKFYDDTDYLVPVIVADVNPYSPPRLKGGVCKVSFYAKDMYRPSLINVIMNSKPTTLDAFKGDGRVCTQIYAGMSLAEACVVIGKYFVGVSNACLLGVLRDSIEQMCLTIKYASVMGDSVLVPALAIDF